jgi:hypothetical protein
MSYVIPEGDDVDFNLINYSIPDGDSVDFNLGEIGFNAEKTIFNFKSLMGLTEGITSTDAEITVFNTRVLEGKSAVITIGSATITGFNTETLEGVVNIITTIDGTITSLNTEVLLGTTFGIGESDGILGLINLEGLEASFTAFSFVNADTTVFNALVLEGDTSVITQTDGTVQSFNFHPLSGEGNALVFGNAVIQTTNFIGLTGSFFIPVIDVPSVILLRSFVRRIVMDNAIKKGDIGTPLNVVLQGRNGPIDLSTASMAKLFMRSRSGINKINGEPMTFVNRTEGHLRYDFKSVDVDTSGPFLIEIRVTWPGGRFETFPNDGQNTLLISENLVQPVP